MGYVISFGNTNSAIKAERCLLGRKINVGVIPLPSQIKGGCGICLRVGQSEISRALTALAEENIGGIGLFSRKEENGAFAYQCAQEGIDFPFGK